MCCWQVVAGRGRRGCFGREEGGEHLMGRDEKVAGQWRCNEKTVMMVRLGIGSGVIMWRWR